MTANENITNAKPKKKSSGFVTALAVILAIIFVFVATIGLIGFNVWRVLFNPTLVKETLTEEVTTSQIVPSTLEMFSEWRAQARVDNKEALSGVTEPDIVLLLSFLKAEDWKEIKDLLITDEFVIHLISTSIDGIYRWIDSEDIWPQITWDMTQLKQQMSGQNGEDAITVAYLKLPIATEEDIADFKSRLAKVPPGVEVLYNLAQFPEPWHEDQINDYIDALDDAAENISEKFVFSEVFGMSLSIPDTSLILAKNLLRLIRNLALTSWIAALVLLLLIAAIKVRSKRTLGKFIGIPLAISGIIAMVMALVMQPMIIKLVTSNLLESISEYAHNEISNSLVRLSLVFFTPLLIQGAVIAGIGVLLIVLMFVIKKNVITVDSEKLAA